MKFWWLFAIIIVCVGFDQLTKRWAQDTLVGSRGTFSVSYEGDCPTSIRAQFPQEPSRRVRQICREARAGVSLRPVIDVVPGYFELEYAQNRGAAFGTFGHDAPTWARIYLHVGAAVGLLFFLNLAIAFFRVRRPMLAILSATCAAGAIGNIWDRATLGYVIDFVLWRVGDTEWPIFNIADACVSVGFFGLLFLAFVEVWKLRKKIRNKRS